MTGEERKDDSLRLRDLPMMMLGAFLAFGIPIIAIFLTVAYFDPTFDFIWWLLPFSLAIGFGWAFIYTRFIFDWWMGAK